VFWLYEWIDDRGVTSLARAEQRLRDPRELARLQERAAAVPYITEPIDSSEGEMLLGGRGIDLSGDLDCFDWSCRKKQVDTLLSHAWHYFDRVVVTGPAASRVTSELENGATDLVIDRLLSDVQLLLYLRDIGADSLLLFRQKASPCEIHVEQHAHEVGLDAALGRLDELADRFAQEAQIDTRRHDDHVHYVFVHPRFEHTVWGTAWPKQNDLRREVSRAVLGRYMSHLTSDVRTATVLNLPLVSTIQMHGDLLGLTGPALSTAQVIFNLRLPILAGIDVRTLLQLRDEEREYFERFRQALRVAAGEQLRSGQGDAQVAAKSVQREVIEPALLDISVRLRAAADTLASKTRVTTSLSAVLTACGVYLGEPLIATAGIATAGVSVQAAMKHADDVGQVRLSDMFFLWQAQQHCH